MTNEPAKADDAEGVPAWTWLRHIGAHAGDVDGRPEDAELGIDEVRRVCERAWKYSRADFEPNTRVELRVSQWRETCALAGSMAESIMLGSAAYTEAVWHQRLIADGSEPPGMALAQRYLAESAIDTAVSVGHRLINFVARVGRTSPEVRDRMGTTRAFKELGPGYVPFATEDRDAWLSLNAKEVQRLRGVLGPDVHGGALDALDELVASSEWESLFDLRAENFHRWRKEHEYTVGVDSQSGTATDIYDEHGVHVGRSIGGHGRKHRSGDGLTERTTSVAGAGIRRVATALDATITNTLTALPLLSGGFLLQIDGVSGYRISRTR
ncbi:hypothetical protein [Gordonia sp. 852002-51296_SCH5728562-b]|uniref:hypothetical protein n=1 Tax=Gordonia sp. 852002-51296_SCH5728562-b TaxID=1834101 RepID=UPI0007E9319F|nr:hypothetical protein [Gordonia sp. 852002-51296_SCH5728562-b]OBA40789.1 hypothetical protein A5766_01995 [Gordonia sp. 852002-51296_SCH5728562-b]